MKIFKCTLNELCFRTDHYTARITILENDVEREFIVGDSLMTSRISFIDFRHGLLVTQNTIYNFK